MGVRLEIADLTKAFLTNKTTKAIVLNDLPDTTTEERNYVNDLIYTVSKGVFENIPSCECGKLNSAYNIGLMCDVCHTSVQRRAESPLEYLIWIRNPKGVAPFMNPRVWSILDQVFTTSSFRILLYLADTSYKPPMNMQADKEARIVNEIHKAGIVDRGWNYLHDNFDFIFNQLLNVIRKLDKRYDFQDALIKFVEQYRDRIYTNYIPMPNRSLLVIEDTDSGRWRDKNIDTIINAMRLMTGVDVSEHKRSLGNLQNRTAKTVDLISDYHQQIERANSRKEGEWRKHVFGTRTHFSCRAVISSITEPHDYYEVHMAWGCATAILRYQILNKLEKRGFNHRQQINFINKYALEYNPLLDTIFKELIAESPFHGIPIIHTRNPVLCLGSTQLEYITKVKTDTKDPTNSTGILLVRPWNLDFDGDQMSSQLTLDNHTTRAFQSLEPHLSGFGMHEPFEVSGNVWLPKPVVAVVSNWLADPVHDIPDPAKYQLLSEMLKGNKNG